MYKFLVTNDQAYKVVEAKEFFKLINEWFDIDKEQDGTMRVLKNSDGQMYLVEGEEEQSIVLGINNTATAFEAEWEIKKVISENVEQHYRVDLGVKQVVH